MENGLKGEKRNTNWDTTILDTLAHQPNSAVFQVLNGNKTEQD